MSGRPVVPARIAPITWLTLIGCTAGALFSAGAAWALDDLYRPSGRPVIVVLSLLLAAVGPAIVRRREADSSAPYYLGCSVLLVGASSYFAADPRVAALMPSVFGLITLTAAIRGSLRSTLVILASSLAAGTAAMLLRTGLTPLGLSLSLTVDVITVLPALTVLYYRQHLEAALATVHEVAARDPLTGLLNRRGLVERLPSTVERARSDGLWLGILMIDVDHFKAFNDRFGHLAGDEALRQVADTVSVLVRAGDLATRLGGEELCVVCTLDAPEDLPAMAERIRSAIEQSSPGVTVSVGGVVALPASLDGGGPALEELLWGLIDRADGLLYEAKSAGRNAVRVLAA